MSFITYKQADSRWGSKNYNGSSSMAGAGCGPTSVAMLAYAVDGKTDPWDVALFMKRNGYAVYNNGTAWSGIPAAMKHYGLKDVRNIAEMKDVWDYLAHDGTCAVFLFRGGSRGGICWTTSGHYVAITDYKIKDGKHWLYTRDSGGRNHTGWYCYETQMKGLIQQIWCGTLPKAEKARTTYQGAFPSLTAYTGELIAQRAKLLAWPYGTPKSKRIYPKGSPTPAFKRALKKAFPNRKGWNRQAAAGASCDVSAAVTLRDVRYDTSIPRGLSDQQGHFARNKDLWKKTNIHNHKRMRPGDVIYYRTKKGGGHIAIYVGDGYICEGGFGGKRFMTTSKAKDYNPGKYRFYALYRPRKTLHKVFRKGDRGVQIKRLQKLLKWAGYYKGNMDGVFGNLTENAVVLFKRDNGFEKINGRFGTKSLRVAKKLKR